MAVDSQEGKFSEASAVRTSEITTNISKAICALKKDLKGKFVDKTKKNEQQKYTYSAMDDYLKVIDESLIDHELFVIGSVINVKRLPDRTSKGGTKFNAVEIKFTTRVNHSSGEFMEIDTYGDGEDMTDKAIYKATTGSRKYGIACLFNLATKDDPEGPSDRDEIKDQSASRGQWGGYQNRQTYQKQNSNYKDNKIAHLPARSPQSTEQKTTQKTIEQWEKIIIGQTTVGKIDSAFATAQKAYSKDSSALDRFVAAADKAKENLKNKGK